MDSQRQGELGKTEMTTLIKRLVEYDKMKKDDPKVLQLENHEDNVFMRRKDLSELFLKELPDYFIY